MDDKATVDPGRLDAQVGLTNRLWYLNWLLATASLIAPMPGLGDMTAPVLGFTVPASRAWPIFFFGSFGLTLASVRSARVWIERVAQLGTRPRPASLLIAAGQITPLTVGAWLVLPTVLAAMLPGAMGNWRGTISVWGGLMILAGVFVGVHRYGQQVITFDQDTGERLTFSGWLHAFIRVVEAVVLLYALLVISYATLLDLNVDGLRSLYVVAGSLVVLRMVEVIGRLGEARIDKAASLRWPAFAAARTASTPVVAEATAHRHLPRQSLPAPKRQRGIQHPPQPQHPRNHRSPSMVP